MFHASLCYGLLCWWPVSQGVREKARVFETSISFKWPDVAVLCAFSGNTIACSCSMSATGAPSKALKVRPLAAKHYQLRHSCPFPNYLVKCVPGFTVRLLSCISQSELITVLTTGLVYCGSYTTHLQACPEHSMQTLLINFYMWTRNDE